MKNVYLIGLLVFIALSCKDQDIVKSQKSDDNHMVAVVTHSAGDRWEVEDDYLPLPVNVGIVNNRDVLILSDRLSENKSLSVLPLGAISVIEGDSIKTYIVSIPKEENLRTISVDDIDELATTYSSVKWIVEQYMINRKGGNRVQLKSWLGQKSAINYLIK